MEAFLCTSLLVVLGDFKLVLPADLYELMLISTSLLVEELADL